LGRDRRQPTAGHLSPLDIGWDGPNPDAGEDRPEDCAEPLLLGECAVPRDGDAVDVSTAF